MTARDVDAVIVGGGHNGLVAAAYLGRAGLQVLLLERLPHVGGAAVSSQVFDGVDARLSRYAYLVSLLPARILDDLGATVRLAPRPYSSYTPDPATAGRTGLLIGPRSTFDAIGAHDDERDQQRRHHDRPSDADGDRAREPGRGEHYQRSPAQLGLQRSPLKLVQSVRRYSDREQERPQGGPQAVGVKRRSG